MINRRLCTAFFFFLFLVFSVFTLEPGKKVRIGIYEDNTLFTIDEKNTKSGYAYEFLQEISKYTNWNYEYFPFAGEWDTQADKLKSRDLDILTKSTTGGDFDEIEFAVSDSPLLITSTVLVTNPQNAYLWKNHEERKTLTIGITQDNFYEQQIQNFCAARGITPVFAYFSDDISLHNALHTSKSVQAILTLRPFESSKELYLAEFEPFKIYFVLNKQNTELLAELNKAMAMIDRYSTAVRSTLNKKYMEHKENEDAFSLTLEEYFYLEEHKKSGETLEAIITPARAPVSYFENGTPKGICYDIIHTALQPLGLQFSLIETKTQAEYLNTIDLEKPGILLARRKDLTWAEQEGYRFTDPYITLTYTSLHLKNYTPEVIRAASIESPVLMDSYIKKYYSDDQINIFNTMDECILSLLNKESSMVILDSYTAQYYLEKDYKHQLEEEAIPSLQWDLCIAVNNSLDARLFSILNKAVRNISDESRYDAVYANTHEHPDEGLMNLSELLYTRPLLFIILLIAPFLLAVLIGLNIYSTRTQRKLFRAMEEKSRFGSVLCSSFDTVSEWNLDDNTIQYYFVIESQIVKQKDFFTVAEFIEHAKKHVLHPDDADAFSAVFETANLESLLSHPRTIYKEYRLLTPGSKNKSGYEWNSVTLQAFSSYHHNRSFIICLKNIDDVKHNEELKNEQLREALLMAEKANKGKSDFLSRMSHEIRTPLNAILGFITLAKRTINESQKALDYMEKSEYASKHLLSIINDILDMSAIESGKMKIKEDVFELKPFISSLSGIFYGQAKLKSIHFSTIITNITEEYLYGDQVRLNQILMNILSNAIKFTPVDGNVSLTITQKLIKGSTVYMQFKVADTGIGMSDEFLQKIGKPFEQESIQISRDFGGSGLGISISKNLIHAMNGTMIIESEENKGSIFTIEVPLKLAGHKPLQKSTKYQDYRVLIITKDMELGEYEKKLFAYFGIETTLMQDSISVSEHLTLEQKPYSLCLIDADVPSEAPHDFVQKIKQVIPEGTPIAVLSYDFSQFEEKVRELSILHFIQKPLFQSTILNLLTEVFGGYQAEKQNEKVRDFSGKHILLAEDNDFNSEIAVDILSSRGFIIDSVRNGKDAVEFFDKSPVSFYDLVLLDIQMPVLNGHEACKAIRNLQRSDAETVPIIAMTANALAEDVSAALSSGMNDHIAKPIDTNNLFTVLKRYIPV